MKKALFCIICMLQLFAISAMSQNYVRYKCVKIIEPNGVVYESAAQSSTQFCITDRYLKIQGGLTYQFYTQQGGNKVYARYIEATRFTPGHWDLDGGLSVVYVVSRDKKTINEKNNYGNTYVYKLFDTNEIGTMYE